MKVRRLPEEVISRIAAGEVIERPASVLKELLENSLDAGAAKIIVESSGAGRKLLRVVDDGSGMSPEDCRLALERHATSKISQFEDLDRLSTFGFRGEALFSVAAVSKLKLSSCLRGSKKGWTIQADAGRIVAEHEAPPVEGTSIEIADLFFNTPARLKFLKSDASEKSHLLHVIEETAMAHPEISIVYKSEGRTAAQFAAPRTPAPDRLHLERVSEVLGEELSNGLLSLREERGGLRLRALLAPTDNLHPSRNFQFFFINRRPVTSRILQQALYRAYGPFRSRERHPVAVVYLELPPDQFDVNVHPAKREVRFKSENEIYQALVGAFSSSLLSSKGIPALTPDSPRRRLAEIYPPQAPAPWKLEDRPDIQPRFRETLQMELPSAWPASEEATAAATPRWFSPPFRFLGQVEHSYLVFEAAGGLLVIDQHAAQERILFERYLAEIESGDIPRQALLLPVQLEMPASQIQKILARTETLEQAGFKVEAFGRASLRVTEVPAVFKKDHDVKEVVQRLLESFQSGTSAAADVKKHAVATIACKAVVKAHDRLSPAEALRLLNDLKDCRDGTCCPHGRPSMIALNRDELARRFKRPGAPPL